MGRKKFSASNRHCSRRMTLKAFWIKYKNAVIIPIITSSVTTVIFRLLTDWILLKQE